MLVQKVKNKHQSVIAQTVHQERTTLIQHKWHAFPVTKENILLPQVLKTAHRVAQELIKTVKAKQTALIVILDCTKKKKV
jgi:hypothetical protein